MIELAVVGSIVVAGVALSNLLIAKLPVPAARNQFELLDVVSGVVCYAAFISALSALAGPHFKNHFVFYLASTLLLHGAGFLIVQDFLAALNPRSGVQRFSLLVLFQCVFAVAFLVVIPAWARWRSG